MEQSMYTWQILDWKATEGDTDVWNFHKDCGNTRVSSTRETLGRTYHNCCWCLRNGWILLELFSGSSLYENMDGHTIMFQVAVKNIYPDVTKLAPPVQKIVTRCLCPAEDRISYFWTCCSIYRLTNFMIPLGPSFASQYISWKVTKSSVRTLYYTYQTYSSLS